jgi:hypothetical protein
VQVLGQIEGIQEADLVAQALVLNPLPYFLCRTIENDLLGTGDIVTVDGDMDALLATFNGRPISDSVGLGSGSSGFGTVVWGNVRP